MSSRVPLPGRKIADNFSAPPGPCYPGAMRPSLAGLPLGLALVVSACGAPVVQPLEDAKRREPDKAVPKDSKTAAATTASPEQPAAPEVKPEPYARTGDAKDQRDELRFWGFSADSKRYAFETYYHGPGATHCEGQASLFVVDAETDAFVADTPLVLKHKQPEAEKCDPPDLRAEMDRHREEMLHRHGIVVGNQGPAIVPGPAITEKGTGRSSTIALPGGKQLRAELEVLGGDREKVGEVGAAYKLTLFADAEPKSLVVEPGERKRPFMWDYSLDEGVVFVSPDKRHLAIVLGTTQRSFEGDRHSYMSNAVKLPDGW